MKPLPKFKTLEEEALFWESHEILDYIDSDDFKPMSSSEIKKYIVNSAKPKKTNQTYFPLMLDNRLMEKALQQSKKKQAPIDTILQNWIKKGSKE